MLFTIVALVTVILSYVYLNKLKRIYYIVQKVNELPGKKGYPLLGNILELWGTPDFVFRSITSIFRDYSRNGVLRLWMGPMPYVLIAEPDILEGILRNPINNSKGLAYNVIRPWLNDGLLTSTGQKWHARRKLLTPGFHFNVLQKFLSIFNKESKCFVDALVANINKETDVTTSVGKFTLNTIVETAMGTTLRDHQEEGEKYRSSIHEFGLIVIERTIKTWLLVDAIFWFSSIHSKQEKVLNTLHGYTDRVLAARKKDFTESKGTQEDENISSGFNRKQAMLNLLISAQRQGENIDDEGIKEEVDTFVFEGHDTTSVSLSFSLMLLANNTKCQEKIYEELRSVFGDDDRDPTNSDLQELKYLECCIKESLRLYPSVPKIIRKLGEEITLNNGHVIPKDTSMLVLIYEMHRRAELYPDPEKFDPDRFLPEKTITRHPYAYIPFSAGPRNCIGQKFAMMEIKCLLSAILRNYILEPVDTPDTITCIMDLVLRTKDPIRVKFVPRK